MRLSEKKKPALVLSGGGVKAAAFHAGVCLALHEKGFRFAGGTKDEVDQHGHDSKTFRCYVGSSAGAIVASFLASGYTVNDFIDAFEMGAGLKSKKEAPKSSTHRLKPLTYFDIFSINGLNFVHVIPKFLQRKAISVSGGLEVLVKNGFKVNGVFTMNGLERYLRRNVLPTNRFRELGVELYVVATQLNHSRKIIFGPFNETTKAPGIKWANYATISQAAAASASLPPMFAPYGIKDDKGREIYFFDGEIRDTLSTHVAADNGADLIVASYSIQPYHFNKEMGSLHHYGIPIILNQALYQVVEQKIKRAIQHQSDIKSLINVVDGYFKQEGLAEEHRERIVKIMADRVNYRQGVDYIYIHPQPEDYEMFFVDHFSLNPKILGRIVRIGFKSAVAALRRHNL